MPASVALKIQDCLAQLETDGHVTVREIPWLAESGRAPKPFWDSLLANASTAGGLTVPLKSVALESYDFFSDAIKRHTPERAAFRWYDADEGRFETFTVGELDMLCGRRAKEWEGRGISSGQTVALMYFMGPDFVISLLTALKLGCIVTVIPPRYELAMKKLIESAAPDHFAIDPIHLRYLGDAKEKAIPVDLPPATESLDTSGVYTTNTPWAKLASPFAAKPFEAVPVIADCGFLWALRDGMIAFGLKPNDVFFAPAVPLIPAQPTLLLATLLAGGVYVHADLEHLKKKPALLDAQWKHVIVTREVRDLILDAGGKLGRGWKSWSRFVDEGGDSQRWGTFVTQACLEPSYTCNYLVDAASGGGIHCSVKRKLSKGGWNSYVLPAPGTEWYLTTPNGKDIRTAGQIGRYTFKKPAEEAALPGLNLVRRDRAELQFLGPALPHRLGRTYPADEVLASVEAFPFVLEATIAPTPTGDAETPYQFTLAIFCGHELKEEMATQAGEWRNLVEGAIKRDLGAEALPDVIEFFPLYARRKEGLTDHDWVRAMYAAGSLHERARAEPFTLITHLRSLVLPWAPPQATPPPPAEGEQPPSDSPPPEETPPSDSPPPEETPPSDAPPPDAPPSDAPPSDAPPSDAPPSDTPPDAPPSDAPPSETPTDAPPAEVSAETPTEAPPADAPPPGAPPAEAPADGVSEPPPSQQDEHVQESGSGPIPNTESDVMLIVQDDQELPPPTPSPDAENPPKAE